GLSPPVSSPLSLHDALPIWRRLDEILAVVQDRQANVDRQSVLVAIEVGGVDGDLEVLVNPPLGRILRDVRRQVDESPGLGQTRKDRKSTRLNSSHVAISYAV